MLHHKKTSKVVPDFFVRKIVKWRWLIYPWAITEDLTGFVKRLERKPANAAELHNLLHNRHGLEIPETLAAAILADPIFQAEG